MKKHRRFFLKTLFNLGLFSLLPIRLQAFNFVGDCETTPDIEGPFYIENPPNISILTPPEITSNFLFITGTVYANDCKTPIPNALVDVWHANKGDYNEKTNSYLNSDYEDIFYRGQIYTDISGNYAYQTIVPGKYLNGTMYRPSHIHYKSSYLAQSELTTQLYFEGDTSIELDPWASDSLAINRIIPLTIDENNNSHGIFDITLNVNSSDIINTTSLGENKFIKSIYPNPVNEQTIIYLDNKNTDIYIEIFDINGKTIGKSQNITNSRIRLYDILNQNLNKGVYILRIIKNKTAIDSKRFVI